MNIRTALVEEYDARRRRNRRYSIRAYARFLGTHHSTLSQLLNGRRRMTSRTIRHLGPRLGLSAEQIALACEEENCETLVRLLSDQRFRPNTRWIAMMIGVPVDAVNISIQRLLCERRMSMRSTTTWIEAIPE